MKIAVQMYTLRSECEKDFFGTLEKVANLGFQGVEFAGFYGFSALEVKEQLDKLGLTAMGSHTAIEALDKDLDASIEYNLVLGNPYIICPYSRWADRQGLEAIAATLNKASKAIKEKGMTLLYHNHAHEFDLVDGQCGLDLLFDLTKETGVAIELDTHWLSRVEVDPIEYMNKYGSRCKLVHLKDLKIVEGEKTFGALGEGNMDIKGIILAAQNIGMEWLTVENDMPKPSGLENIAISMVYLKNLGY